MGRNRIVIERVSGHGCDRDAVPGDTLKRCAADYCLECRLADLLVKCGGGFDADGCGATMTHWPNDKGGTEVVDDYITGRRRHGSFKR